MRRIQYDNFKTSVEEVPDSPAGPLRVLQLTDHDTKTVHEFAYPAGDASKVGAAMQGSAVRAVPASALEDLKKPVPGEPLRRRP